MSDVFISYSRKDIAFARLIHASLQQNKIDTWIDWERIPIGEHWWREICLAIENANVFMFIISNNSIGSPICKDEIDLALKNHKRIIPIIVDDLGPEVVGRFVPDLTKINWIIFERDHVFQVEERPEIQSEKPEDRQVALPKPPQFEKMLEKLSAAIHTDWNWVKYHTQLQVDGLQWRNNHQDASYLLQGTALDEAEQQLLRASGKDPQPTELQVEYLSASRDEEKRRQEEKRELERKALQRQRLALWAIGVGLVAAVILGVLAWGQRNQYLTEANVRATAEVNAINQQTVAVAQRATAQAASTLAVEQRNEAERQATNSLSSQLAAQSQTKLSTQLDLAMLLAAKSFLTADTYQSRSSLLLALEQSPQLARIYRYAEKITALAFTPDGTELAAAGCAQRDEKQDACLQNEIIFYNLIGGKTDRVLTAGKGRLTGLAFTPDGAHLFATFANERIVRFDLSAGNQPISVPLKVFEHSNGTVIVSPDGEYMASAGCDYFSMPGGLCSQGSIVLWDLRNDNPSGLVLNGVGTQMHNLAFSPKSDRLYAGDCAGQLKDSCNKGQVKTWNLPDGSMQEHPIAGTTSAIISADVSADGKLLAAGEAAGIVHIIELETWKQLRSYTQKPQLDSLLFSRYGNDQILASLGWGTTLEIHSATNSRDTISLDPYQSAQFVNALAISPDGRFLASTSCVIPGLSWYDCKEGQIYVWDLFTWQPVARVFGGSDHLQWNSWQVGFDSSAPQNPIVVAASSEEIVAWDVEKNLPDGKPFITGADIDFTQSFLSHSGKVLAYLDLIGYVESTQVYFWDAATRQAVGVPVSIDGWALHAKFSPDDRWMVSDGPKESFLVWDPTTGQLVRQITMTLNPGFIELAFSPDGKTLAAAGCIRSVGDQPCQTYRIERFELETGKLIGKPFEGATNGNVNQLVFSVDGKKIGINTFMPKPTDTWWDIESGQPDLQMGSLAVEAIRSPDGRYSVRLDSHGTSCQGCGVGLITLWDIQKHEPVGQPIRNPGSNVRFLGFSPDSRFLYTSGDGKMIVWSLDAQDWLARICKVTNRNFTPEEWSIYFGQTETQVTCKLAPLQ
ncbi:MAG: TIR domain-containing protein [Chloroflexota bacterium]